MSLVVNTLVYAPEWSIKLQERLASPTIWKDICRVEYTDSKVLVNPYLTDASVQVGTRGSAYTMQAVVQTEEQVLIDTYRILAQFIDRADLAQSTYVRQMELADSQGVLLNETIAAAVFANYDSATAFDQDTLFGTTGTQGSSITVSAANIDDIILAMKRRIRIADGESLMNRYGAFIVWRPADFEKLESFMMANGFVTADTALRGGAGQAVTYMGVTHYSSNLLTAGHLIAGVKNVYHLGICKSTYGQIMVDEKDPGRTSGVSVVSRVDFKPMIWLKTKPVIFDIKVS